jgi:hypothetical protein
MSHHTAIARELGSEASGMSARQYAEAYAAGERGGVEGLLELEPDDHPELRAELAETRSAMLAAVSDRTGAPLFHRATAPERELLALAVSMMQEAFASMAEQLTAINGLAGAARASGLVALPDVDAAHVPAAGLVVARCRGSRRRGRAQSSGGEEPARRHESRALRRARRYRCAELSAATHA